LIAGCLVAVGCHVLKPVRCRTFEAWHQTNNVGHWIGFEAYEGVFLALDFNGDEFLCVIFRCTMVGGSERGTFSLVDLV
jgi:hypothetical protein